MQIYIFGNPDLPFDALPLQLIPELEKRFPQYTFTILDPNEEWVVPRDMFIIDTVVGIKQVTAFDSLEAFIGAPKVTCHDFDAYSNLQFLMKLKKIDSVHIIGIPPILTKEKALEEVSIRLKEY
jgi:hypothetical protein